MPELEGTTLLAVAACIAASVVAIVLAVRVAALGRTTGKMRSELEELRKESRGGRKQREQREKALRQAGSELDRATRKLAQAEKRAAQGRGDARDERKVAEERIRALASEVDEARGEVVRLETALVQTRRDIEAAMEHVARAEGRAAAAERAEAAAPPIGDPAEISELNERVASAERLAAEREAAFEKASDQVARLLPRLETKDTLYSSIRSDLGAKKDKIRQQREELERLRAYKVALFDTSEEPGDPESAD